MSTCKICNHNLESVINFGEMPISNRYVTDPGISDEYTYVLEVAFCPSCYMVQLVNCVEPTEMFNDEYAFYSSTSSGMEKHFKEQADEIIHFNDDMERPFVVELGCNDGIMLKHIATAGISHLGVEPSANVADIAITNGVNVAKIFFNVESADQIKKEYGAATVICGSNVTCHIEDINSVFEGVSHLLSDDGIFFFEDPYIYDIVSKHSFDQIYDEHIYYFSALSVKNLAERHGLELYDVKFHEVHGGEARYYIRRKSGESNDVTVSVQKCLDKEKSINLHKIEGYKEFKDNVDKVSSDLKQILVDLKAQGHEVVGYGATSKSTTLLKYAGVDNSLIKFISDTTPTKINKFTPGTHIPIKPYEAFINECPEYTLLLAWNHKNEILEKESNYRNNGGKFITFFPEVGVE